MRSIEAHLFFHLVPETEFKGGLFTLTFSDGTVWTTDSSMDIHSALAAILWLQPTDLPKFLREFSQNKGPIVEEWHKRYMKEYLKSSTHATEDVITLDDLLGEL